MKGFIFDCDGTLIDSEYTHFLSWNRVLEKRGGRLTEEEYHHFAGSSGPFTAQRLCDRLGSGSSEVFYAEKRENYLNLLKQGLPPIQRTVDFVKQLASQKKELGIKLAVASAGFMEEILLHLEHAGIADLFDAIISGQDDLGAYQDPEGVNKPKPYIYLHTARLLSLDPSECIAFEDSVTGLLAAVRAGMRTVAVPNAYTKHHDFSLASVRVDPGMPLVLADLLAVKVSQDGKIRQDGLPKC